MEVAQTWVSEAIGWLSQFDYAEFGTWLLVNKYARAIGLLILVLVTIWVIALVYSGYARDSDLGPLALRAHTNKKLGNSAIVFNQTMYPFQMDSVEATVSVFYNYEDREGQSHKIEVLAPQTLKMHIRSSPIPPDDKTIYGFESADADIGALPQESVHYPSFQLKSEPEVIGATPRSVREYIELHALEPQWTDDDDAPVVSLGPALIDAISEARKTHVVDQANRWVECQKPGMLNSMNRARVARERANVFGSYSIKMQFSKRPDFVLFKHPNRELKMTAWLTLLTSVFSIAMDLWPVELKSRGAGTQPATERSIRLPPTPSTRQ